MTDVELRAAVKDTIIDIEIGRCGMMEGVERIMADVARFERGAGGPRPTAYPLYGLTARSAAQRGTCKPPYDVTNYYLEAEDEVIASTDW